jgi:putative serine protease PepD
MNRRRTVSVAAAVLATAAVGAGGAATYAGLSSDGTNTVVRQTTVTGSQPAAARSGLTAGEVYRQTYEGVVEITATREAGATPFGPQRSQAGGSGFVYDDEGHIVTNHHVVDGAGSISVRFPSGQTYTAKLVGSDPSTDLAVLEVDAPASVLEPLALADSNDVAVGDPVVAIGSPFGLEDTITSGIVSALHRQMTAPNGFPIGDAIQTDAAINHGNSGGPLLDSAAEVIGVNAQIESESGGNDGVGFAIPSNTVRAVVSELISAGKVEHAYLGIAVEDTPDGARISEVRPGTPAEEEGLRAGDLITAVDGRNMTSAEDVTSAISAKRPGDAISVTYTRGGESHTVDATLATRPDSAS